MNRPENPYQGKQKADGNTVHVDINHGGHQVFEEGVTAGAEFWATELEAGRGPDYLFLDGYKIMTCRIIATRNKQIAAWLRGATKE